MITAQQLQEQIQNHLFQDCEHYEYNSATGEYTNYPDECIANWDTDAAEYYDCLLRLLVPFFAEVWQEGKGSFGENPYENYSISEPEAMFTVVADKDGEEYYRAPNGVWRHGISDVSVDWDHIKAVRVVRRSS